MTRLWFPCFILMSAAAFGCNRNKSDAPAAASAAPAVVPSASAAPIPSVSATPPAAAASDTQERRQRRAKFQRKKTTRTRRKPSFLIPQDIGVFQFTKEVNGLSVVSDAQIYLDLLKMPGRAKEQAQNLRAKIINMEIKEHE